MQRTQTTLQPRLAVQTRRSGPQYERVADPQCTAVASCSIGGCDPSSVITASLPLLLCCACCVICATCRASGARREKKRIWIFGNMVKWSRCPILGLDPGSSSQYILYWLHHVPVHWTRPVHWWFRRSRDRSRLRRDPCPPPTGEGAALEAPCRRHAFTRFGFTRAKEYVVFGPCLKGNLVVD